MRRWAIGSRDPGTRKYRCGQKTGQKTLGAVLRVLARSALFPDIRNPKTWFGADNNHSAIGDAEELNLMPTDGAKTCAVRRLGKSGNAYTIQVAASLGMGRLGTSS